MSNAATGGVQQFVIIADQKKKEKFLTLLSEHDARGIETVYAHGSVHPNALAAAFGLQVEQHKVMITCLVKTETARQLTELLYNEYEFNKPNTGIAFSIPVEGLAF